MNTDDDLENRRQRLGQIGELVVGSTRYQRQLSAMLGVSQSAIAQIVTSRMDLSADLEDRVCELALAQAEQLIQRAMKLARLAVAIADDRRRGLGRLSKSSLQHERDTDAGFPPLEPKPLPKRPTRGVAKAPSRKASSREHVS